MSTSAKYQVFVSSTYQDLREERDLVIKAILEMGHIPVGMEMFSAADEEQWNIIKKQIDQSDYYIVIVAHRYGSCDESGTSFTEKEYDYAVKKGLPTLGFVIEEKVSWPHNKCETDKNALQKLGVFKEKIRQKPVSFWKNGEDLYGCCSIALMKSFNAYPREGWVRASQAQDSAASRELVRLSAENAALRTRLAGYEALADEQLAMQKTLELMRNNTINISFRKKGVADWQSGKTVTLYQVFEVLAPELQVEFPLTGISRYLGTHVLRIPFDQLATTWPTPRNTIRLFLADLAALDCVVPSSRKKLVSDTDEYWSLSDFGTKLLAQMRRRRLEQTESLAKFGTDIDEDIKVDSPGDANTTIAVPAAHSSS
jgi:hypothetical protein